MEVFMRKHFLMVGLAVFLGALLATGCSRMEKPVRVSVFTTDPLLIKILSDTIQNIQTKYPDIKIQVENIPYNSYQDKLTVEMAANDAPDIISVEASKFSDMYLRNAFEDLTPYFDRDKMDRKDYFSSILQRFSPGGEIYALPTDIAPIGLLYYNKKVFDEAGVAYPTSDLQWPEPFLSLCKKLVKKDAQGKIIRWAFADPYGPSADIYLLSNGGYFMDSETNPTRLAMDSPQALQAFQFRWDMMYTYDVSPTPKDISNFNFGNGAEDMFLNGQVAMMCSGIWHTPHFLEKGLDFDVVEFPKGPKGLRGWGSGGSGYAIWKGCKDKEKAWKVLKEIASADLAAKLAGTGMIQPALVKVANSDAFLKSPGPKNKKILLDMPKYSHFAPFIKNWEEVWFGQVGPGLDPMWLGTKKPSEVLPKLTEQINYKYFAQQTPTPVSK
jgi:ABC-type glycerol-3-phosphate transport system substrate-binding protein